MEPIATIQLQFLREAQSPEKTLIYGIMPLKVDLQQALSSHRGSV